MTDDEARSILKADDCDGWISWDNEKDSPNWAGEYVTLDGRFTPEQLHAILHFTMKD